MGQSPASSDVNEVGDGIPFFQGKAEFGKLHPTVRKYCTAPKKIAEENDILLSVRAPVGPTNLADRTTVIGRGLTAIRAEEGKVSYKFLLYHFRSIEPWMGRQGTGTTFKAISGQFLKELECYLPSLAEQKVIADKLDSLLTQVETTKARLDRVPDILKRFRQSVLAAAVSGRLTEEWRSENSDLPAIEFDALREYWNEKYKLINKKIPKISIPKPEVSLDLPHAWVNTQLGYVFDVYVGATPSRSNEDFWEGDIPWVSSSEVAFCRISSTKELITEDGLKSTSTNLHPVGTVMLAMIGQGKTRGQAAILDIEACHNQNTAALRVPEGYALSGYLYFYLTKKYEETRTVGGGNNQKALNKKTVQSLEFSLPPIEEQAEIVRRVEELFAFADAVEQKAQAASERVNKLTQSILAKAFRGELTADWRAANPDLINGENSAEGLLEKIKAEREALKPKKKTRAKKVKG